MENSRFKSEIHSSRDSIEIFPTRMYPFMFLMKIVLHIFVEIQNLMGFHYKESSKKIGIKNISPQQKDGNP